MALTTLNENKTYLGIALSNTDEDAKLEIFRKSVEQSIINYCEVDFEEHVVTKELHDGIQADVIVPKFMPIISVQAVYFSVDADGENGTQVDSDHLSNDETGIMLRGTYSPKPYRRVVRVDYTHGYVVVPDDVKLAVYQSVKAEYNRDSNNTEHLSSRSKESESENYLAAWDKETGLPRQIKYKLQPYRVYEFPNIGMAQRNI